MEKEIIHQLCMMRSVALSSNGIDCQGSGRPRVRRWEAISRVSNFMYGIESQILTAMDPWVQMGI
jgi:hypothetical protein